MIRCSNPPLSFDISLKFHVLHFVQNCTQYNYHTSAIRRLELHYPQFPSEEDFTHRLLGTGDLKQHSEGGELMLLSRFSMEWPRLQAGGLLLPKLVEFYQWLHTQLGKEYLNIMFSTRILRVAFYYPRPKTPNAIFSALKSGSS